MEQQLAALQARLGVNRFPSVFAVTSDQEIGVDCGPGALEPFSYVPIIWSDVFPIYLREADMGNRIAVNNLGVCYQFGRGVAKDEKKAVECYQKALKMGSLLAINNLSMAYLRGAGVDMDEGKAISLLQPLADQGCLMAVSNMGSCFLNGEGVRKDPRAAMDWYERAANEGFAPSQCYLGVMWESGSCREAGKNDAVAAEWFEKAAGQGFKYACYNLAVCYEQGEGVEKDEKRAAELYEKAAAQGELDAQYEIGLCYLYGSGVRRDVNRAMQWLMKAAGQGHAKSQRVCDIERVQTLEVETQAQSRISAYSLPTNKNLLTIKVYAHQIDQINLLHITEVLRFNSTLQHLVMDGTDGVFGDPLAEEVGAALQQPTTALYRLRLYANLQRAKGTVAIGNALLTNRSLHHLDLSVNYITAEGCHSITKALAVNPNFVSIALAGCDLKADAATPFFKAVATHPSLTALDFSQNPFGDDAGVVLADALRVQNRTLTALHLHACGLSTRVVAALSDALKQPDAVLSHVVLSGNRMEGDAMKALAAAMAVNSSVTHLNVSLNPMGDDGCAALAAALAHNTTLTELKADDTSAGAPGLMPWAATVAANTTLRTVALDHAVETTAGWGHALAKNRVLRELTLTHRYYHHSSEQSPRCTCGDVLLSSLSKNTALRVLRAPLCCCTPKAQAPGQAAALALSLLGNRYLSALTLRSGSGAEDDVLNIVDRNARTHARVDRNWQPIAILVPYMRANTASALGATGADFLQTILRFIRD